MKNDHDHHGRRVHRREFLVESAATTAAAVALGAGCGDDDGGEDAGPQAVELGARVVDLEDPGVVGNKGALDAARVTAMLEAGLKELTKQQTLAHAWKVLLPDFSAKMRIGLKINGINWNVHSSPELVKALITTLTRDLGVDAGKIIVWDQISAQLAMAQLTEKDLGVKVQGTISSPTGPGYQATPQKIEGLAVKYSRILTELTDITINCAVLKSHGISGFTGSLKSIYGAIDVPGHFHDNLNSAMPKLNHHSQVKGRFRLSIVEGFIAVAENGPMGPATHKPGRLLLGADPLAVDVHGLSLLNSLRKTPVAQKRLGWIDNAVAEGVGSRTPEVIKRKM